MQKIIQVFNFNNKSKNGFLCIYIIVQCQFEWTPCTYSAFYQPKINCKRSRCMKYPFKITNHDHKRASPYRKGKVQIEHYFVFINQKTNMVLLLVDQPVQLDSVTTTPEPRIIKPIGSVVTIRDFYRAEQDTVFGKSFFIAFPTPAKDLRLVIDCNGALEHRLAPLSARLISHQLKRYTEIFSFELAVESYQMPFDDELMVTLIGTQKREIGHLRLLPLSPGHYADYASDISICGEEKAHSVCA